MNPSIVNNKTIEGFFYLERKEIFMAHKDIKINLMFQADTNAAVANVQKLGVLLDNLATKTVVGVDSGPLQEASSAARSLQVHLQNALNVNTGKLDLTKLNSSLQSSGTNLSTLVNQLKMAGTTGQQTFVKLANAVASAEAPMLNVNNRLADFGKTLKNTIKWELASSAVHGVSGVLSSAVGHAEKLNKALNEIRIVTGYNTASMADFTVQAREAAALLSSTTTDYAKAALIYYQQGLSGEDVLKRASIVTKLSNTTGQSVEIVSEQMTSIWNNFYDGSKSLEYYADAIAKLGAATASSTDEIAMGLQKFASIADTVGLSYEYATASLATMTSETREAADVVGNALKTIFARAESIRLGETLEDGVGLSKYSEALKKADVDILDYKGELKDMDVILSELGNKWSGISRTQQIALAQTVGGVQQYARFISLMDNWKTIENNAEMARSSKGSLEEQQKIWSEGWEASAKRVKQSQESLYEEIINDKFVVVLNDMFAELIDGIHNVFNSMGGIVPVMLTLVGVFSKQVFPAIRQGLTGLQSNIKYMFGKSKSEIQALQKDLSEELDFSINAEVNRDLREQLELSKNLIQAKSRLAEITKHMSLAEQEEALTRMENYEALVAQTQATLARKVALEEEIVKTKMFFETSENRKAIAASLKTREYKELGGSATASDTDKEIESIISDALSMTKPNEVAERITKIRDTFEERKADKTKNIQGQILEAEDNLNRLKSNDQQKYDKSQQGIQERIDKIDAELADLMDEYDRRFRREMAPHVQQRDEQRAIKQRHVDTTLERISRIDAIHNARGSTETDAQARAYAQARQRLEDTLTEQRASQSDTETHYVHTRNRIFAKNNEDRLRREQELQAERDRLQTQLRSGSLKSSEAVLSCERKITKLKQQQLDIENQIQQDDDADVEHLEKVAALQEDIARQAHSTRLASTASAGTATFSGEGDSEVDRILMENFETGFDPFSTSINVSSEASLQNLENAYRIFGEFKALEDEAKAAFQDMGAGFQRTSQLKAALDEASAEADAAAGTDRQSAALAKKEKIQEKLTRANQKYVETVRKTSVHMQQLARSVGMSDAAITDLGDAFNETLSIIGDTNTVLTDTQFEEFQNRIQSLPAALQDSTYLINGLINSMTNILSDALPAEQLNPIIGQFKKLAAEIYSVEIQTGAARRAQEELRLTVSNQDTIWGAFAEGAQAIGLISTGIGAVQSLINACKNGNSVLEVFTTSLAAIGMIIPVVSGAMKGLAAIKTASNLLDAEGIVLGKGIQMSKLINIATTNAETTSLAALVATEILHNTVAMAGLGIVAAAIAATVAFIAVMEHQTKVTRENNEAFIEQAKHSPELIDSWMEQSSAMDILISKYKELKASGEDYYDTAQEIVEQADELVAAFEKIGEELNFDKDKQKQFNDLLNQLKIAASGTDSENLAQIEQITNELDSFIAKEGVRQTKQGLEGAVENMAMDLDDWHGSWTGNQYKVHVGGYGSGEQPVMSFLEDLDSVRIDADKQGANISLNTADPETFIRQYEELSQAAAEIRSYFNENNFDLSTSGTYKELKELIDAGAEGYTVAKEMQTNYSKYKVSEKASELGPISEINSLTEYLDYKDQLVNSFKDTTGQKAATDWLEANTAIQEYLATEQKIKFVGQQIRNAAAFGTEEEKAAAEEAAKNKEEELIALYEAIPEEQKQFFLDINFNKFQSDEAIKAELARLQGVAELEEIEATIGIVDAAQGKLKEGKMTEKSWQELRDSGITWGEKGIISFTDFLAMSYEEQSKYLQKIKQDQADTFAEVGTKTINEMKKNISDLDSLWASGEYSGSEEEYNRERQGMADELSVLEDKISLREHMAGIEQIENLGLNVGEVQQYAKALMTANDAADGISDDLYNNAEAAEVVAIANSRMNKGLKDLGDEYEDLSKTLKDGTKGTSEYNNAMKKLDSIMSDVLNLDVGTLSNDFLTSAENLDLMKKAAKGDTDAIESLRAAAAKDIVQHCDVYLTGDDTVRAKLDQLSAEIDDYAINNNLEIGAYVDDSQFIAACNEIIRTAGMTAQQAGDYFKALGYDANVIWEESVQDPRTETIEEVGYMTGPDGIKVPVDNKITRTYSEQKVKIPVVKALTYTGSAGGTVNFSNTKAGKKGSGGGGGGSKKKAEKPKKADIVERYKEVNDLLDDVADAMEDASKAADRLYGKGRLDLMKKNNDLLKQEIELTKQKKEEALKYLDEDLDAMFKAASEAGVILATDENGLISNYTEVMTELYNELNAEVTKANRDGNASESEQARIDKIQERIDALKDAMSQYDETRELIEDLDNELDEKFYQWQDNNYEMLTYELEIKLELNEDELKLIDYYLNKISDDFYQMAEAAALMVGGDGVSQLEMYTSSLSNYEDHVNSLKEAYANGEISQTAYVEGLREAQDGMLSNLESLNDLDKTMMHYYGETLSMAAEELANYVDHMEHLTEVLDHYQSLMEIMGKSTDYETMGLVLEGKAKALSDQAAVAKATMEMYKDEAADRYQAYQQALLDGDKAAAELYLQQYKDALAAADEAEQEYLASAEEWAEALTAVLENKLSKFGQTLENALTGGTSFDQMTTAMERAASLQEEYLTTTNKIYETNKLMRRAQQEIDKTSNSVAKRRLKSFIEETYQLQNQAQLSNYELEIQQAKYDLLLAEIALEEAQNAKSIVRLQRDSEGNFGYVYTADSAAVAEAEQNVLDKQNNLYNIALQGANDYSQKYQQTLNEMYDTLADLQQQYLEGAFESEEEYHAAVEAAKKYYYDKLQQYSSLHTVAITLDSRVINDAWSAGFNDMLTKTEEWMEAVDIYLDDVGVAFMEWSEYMNRIAADTGTDFDNLEKNVKDIVDESKALKDILIGEDGKGGVVGAIETEIEAVKNIAEMYATLRSELDKVKNAYEEVTAAINATIKAQSQVSSKPGTSTTKYNSSSGGKQGSASEGASGTSSGGGGSGSGGSGGGTANPGGTTDSGIRINLYAARHTSARMGSTLVKQSSKGSISFGSAEYAADNDPSIKMVYASGAGWHGYVTASDRRAIKQAYGFATGGYTGDWDGPYGKLAFLHQKELVLNKEDTENFLASMGILERILQIIDLQSMSSQLGGILSSPMLGVTNNPNLEQNVHIEASFPNATNHNEIEEAFNNLINTASQYANRK